MIDKKSGYLRLRLQWIVAQGDRITRNIIEALLAESVTVLVAVIFRIPGNGTQLFAITAEHLRVEGVFAAATIA